jgi:hypothetical protein
MSTNRATTAAKAAVLLAEYVKYPKFSEWGRMPFAPMGNGDE